MQLRNGSKGKECHTNAFHLFFASGSGGRTRAAEATCALFTSAAAR